MSSTTSGSTATSGTDPQQQLPDPAPGTREKQRDSRSGERFFSGLSTGSGVLILAILAAVAIFLVALAMPTFFDKDEAITMAEFWDYVAPFAFGTVWAAFLALLMAVPVAIGIALFISHYAPRRLAQGLGYLIDLLAAVPSVVFGLWGINVLAPLVQPVYVWLGENLGWIPLFGGVVSGTGRTMLTAAMVLAVMVLPIITALTREVFLQTPRLNEEASLALGATRWEMVRQAVLPFGVPGIVSATMLGLGRALGETMAVAMVLSGKNIISFKVLTSENPNTIAANIALTFPNSNGVQVNLLIATGLVLFVITLAVNMFARWIVGRSGAK